MPRSTGRYVETSTHGERTRAFVPYPLPPAKPPLVVTEKIATLHTAAQMSLARLSVSAAMVPSTAWFRYGFVRKEAVLTSQIEGTQATLRDVLTYEATHQSDRVDVVEEVCNYVDALTSARKQLAAPRGLPLSIRLLFEAHRRLMRGARGATKQPGEVRRSQNWVGGTRPGNARFVPPPPEEVAGALASLERWIHSDDPLPPLIKAGLAHAQFETIHPFLDGNGRIGRLLIALLVEHWSVLSQPLLYVSVALRRHQQEYYARLAAVRTDGDWEGWTAFFLECIRESAEDGVRVAQALHSLLARDRERVVRHQRATVAAIQLLDQLPTRPLITVPAAAKALRLTSPPARKAIELLASLRVLRETTGKQRDRVYGYHDYLRILTGEAD
ncbi:MAG: Fic family protein [Phycisphaerae bacterium]